MKSKVSLTVDPGVTHRAKRYARSKNKSLSSLVEELLDEVSSGDTGKTADLAERPASFSQRWSGQLRASGKGEPRYRALAEKYDL